MTNDSLGASIARIEQALSRIEAIAARAPEARYVRLRERVQLALNSLDTLIARVSGKRDS